jgi:hypothetical protein
MSDFVEWNPKRHGQKPPYWLPDMLTSVDGKNFARQPNWAWIAGSTYYVPPEAVGVVREDVKETDVDRKLLCANRAVSAFYITGENLAEAELVVATMKDACVRAIELWEEGFGK